MRLALAFGCPSWKTVLEQLDPWEYLLWKAKDAIDGIGHELDDRRFASMMASYFTSQGVKDITDDMLRTDMEAHFRRTAKQKTSKQSRRQAQKALICAAFGGSLPQQNILERKRRKEK